MIGTLPADPNYLPKNVLYYASIHAKEFTADHPTIVGLARTIPGLKDCAYAHPMLTLGYNPSFNARVVVVAFSQPVMVTSSDGKVISQIDTLPPHINRVQQALGRSMRNYNNAGFVLFNTAAYYSPVRMIMPPMPQTHQMELFR